jgi:hypothetical protein
MGRIKSVLIRFIVWCGMKTYVLKVKMKYDKRIWRKIEVLGSQTLDDLHVAIQEAFNFDADHLYSFFMSGKAWDHSDFEYYHPDADPQTPLAKKMRTMLSMIRGSHPEPRLPATKVRMESLNLKPKQKFLYLFDYGDEWRFEVEVLKEETSEKAHYPRIVGSRGEAPEQYSDYEEEES